MRAVLQSELVVKENTAIMSQDEVIRQGAKQSIVRKQPWHSRNVGPVFRSESGGGLMTLPGGVLLALDSEWDVDSVEKFFEDNGDSNCIDVGVGIHEERFLGRYLVRVSFLELSQPVGCKERRHRLKSQLGT